MPYRARDRPARCLASILAAFLFVVSGLGGCGTRQPGEPTSTRIENAAFQLVFAQVPDGFDLEANDEASLAFLPSEIAGRVWVELGPLDAGSINLVEIVSGQKEQFTALPEGEFFGNRELRTPLGQPAYYSRGRFDEGDGRVEELRVFQLHPSQYRLLTVFYRYPAGEDSAARVQALLGLLAEMEGAGTEPAESPETAADASADTV